VHGQVFVTCFNTKYGPDFVWDDTARVPPTWRWGDPDPDLSQAASDWVCKFALLLLHGSGSFKPTQLPYTVTREQGCTLTLEGHPAPPIDLNANDWIGVNDGSGTLLQGTVQGVPPGVPKGSVPAGTIAVSPELENHGGQQTGCDVFRATARPPPSFFLGSVDAKSKILCGGIAALDTTVLFDVLTTKGDKGFLVVRVSTIVCERRVNVSKQTHLHACITCQDPCEGALNLHWASTSIARVCYSAVLA
jgi:hypothetical protein